MLRLKLPTDPRWANIAEDNLEEILIDHAFCEQKAASTAISFLVTYPELSELVTEMAALAREEMSHFEMVHKIILERGFVLGRERKDEYVGEISSFFPKTGDRTERLINRLLIAALIEARSCERFKVLSENLKDQELAKFYSRLMVSEANHYSLFIRLARTYGDREEVDQKWESLLNFEGEVMARFGKKEHIHG
ncbi:MAG TPA: tRNA 2-methylthio-N6-isopentenyl adenosine(37) hydroxylase MiaE [Cryomorphaceae bacterium]|nr:tRNA 2-methylthio-N6-isopentenyl adenosine(37) hydroxylase MiaE [Owenweeksia sp.]HAD96168.1 tRNA 2-methylthio-N6-isopentenyl adenosine(37) hydroxylase MiaE [Cryomorphaceae bacterium]HBF20631.1 tRNA 2-methylthio-N6-isopentenyl adenosine(37) hydroxylase MiaE [Cryomorphaceae bacterium]|tara:strand:- start:112 stop:693 length:582 start_codon:yes stop_codon:yes gene_type:complete